MTCSGMCPCFFFKASLARNSAAIPGSASRPKEKASLHARPTAPALAKIAALAVFEKKVVDVGMECAFVCFATLPACAS